MSFEKFYNSTFNGLFRYFYYRYLNKHEAEDLTHETYLRFYKKYSDKKITELEAKKILYGFARNVLKEWIRQNMKLIEVEFIDGIDYEIEMEEIEVLESDSFNKDQEEKNRYLHDAIEELSDYVKTVIKFRYLENLSRKEISEKLGISEDMVHTYQKRGVKYLKQKIGVPPKS